MFDSFQKSMNPTKLAIVKTGNSKSAKNSIINNLPAKVSSSSIKTNNSARAVSTTLSA